MAMRLTIDQESDAAYVYVTEHIVAQTEELDENRMLDLDDAGQVRGIEFLNISHGVSLARLPFPDELAALLKGHGIQETT